MACDVLPETGTIDLADAERRLTPRTIAIMPVHYASNPWHLDAVYSFARDRGLRVVEDAAHAFGCKSHGRMIGSFGDMVCFSFDGIKNITCGEGGAVITADQTAAQRVRDARRCGPSSLMFCPLNRISPRIGSRNPRIVRSSVDFPVPFRPTSATVSPAMTSRLTSVRTGGT